MRTGSVTRSFWRSLLISGLPRQTTFVLTIRTGEGLFRREREESFVVFGTLIPSPNTEDATVAANVLIPVDGTLVDIHVLSPEGFNPSQIAPVQVHRGEAVIDNLLRIG